MPPLLNLAPLPVAVRNILLGWSNAGYRFSPSETYYHMWHGWMKDYNAMDLQHEILHRIRICRRGPHVNRWEYSTYRLRQRRIRIIRPFR